MRASLCRPSDCNVSRASIRSAGAERRSSKSGSRPAAAAAWPRLVFGGLTCSATRVDATSRRNRALRDDPVQLRGAARYEALVQMCRDNDILTPEDEFAIWPDSSGPVTIVPLFLLYDHSWYSAYSLTFTSVFSSRSISA